MKAKVLENGQKRMVGTRVMTVTVACEDDAILFAENEMDNDRSECVCDVWRR